MVEIVNHIEDDPFFRCELNPKDPLLDERWVTQRNVYTAHLGMEKSGEHFDAYTLAKMHYQVLSDLVNLAGRTSRNRSGFRSAYGDSIEALHTLLVRCIEIVVPFWTLESENGKREADEYREYQVQRNGSDGPFKILNSTGSRVAKFGDVSRGREIARMLLCLDVRIKHPAVFVDLFVRYAQAGYFDPDDIHIEKGEPRTLFTRVMSAQHVDVPLARALILSGADIMVGVATGEIYSKRQQCWLPEGDPDAVLDSLDDGDGSLAKILKNARMRRAIFAFSSPEDGSP